MIPPARWPACGGPRSFASTGEPWARGPAPEALGAGSGRRYNCPAMSRAVSRRSTTEVPVFTGPRQRARALDRLVPALVALAVAGYIALFGWLSLHEYWAYEMHALDMGNMGQAAWNTVHGHPFAFTNMRLPYLIEAWNTTTRLSFHVEALFPVISLVYLIFPHPESLLVLQTLAVASGAIPTYLLARDTLDNRLAALVFALAYLLFPTVEAVNLYEFHPVALATPLLLAAFLFMKRRRYVPFAVCCLAAMGTKEQIGLIVAMFGLYLAFVQKERRLGLWTFAIGVGWSLFAALVIEKHFRTAGTVTYIASRYGYLCGGPNASGQVHCHGLHGPVHTILHDPGAIARAIFVWPKLGYLRFLLAPVGYTALFAPAALITAAPTLALNLLSTDGHMYSGVGDNSAEIAAVVVIAGILGAGRLQNWLGRLVSPGIATGLISAYVLATALWNQHVDGFTPMGAAFHVPTIDAHTKLENRFVAMVPSSAAVSTQDQLDPHLSSRRYLYLFRDLGTQPYLYPASYVLLDVSAPTYPLPSYQLHDAAVQMMGHGWGVEAADDGLLLLKKGASSTRLPAAFYRFSGAQGVTPPHSIGTRDTTLGLLGYGVQRTDLANYRTPNLEYTVYFRPLKRIRSNMQPVVYERMGNTLVNCSSTPLGLDWFPTSKWKPGREYQVRMAPIETDWNIPGTLRFSLEIRSAPGRVHGTTPSCAELWNQHVLDHSHVWNVGSMHTDF